MSLPDLDIEIDPIDTTVIISSFIGEVLDLFGNPPPVVIHASDPFRIHAIITLAGPFAKMMCGELGVQVNIESIGPGSEVVVGPDYQVLDPCGNGVYHFDFDIRPGTLTAQGVGTPYKAIFTFATKQCNATGPVHGHAGELHFSLHP
jgi:hypothetical protein